MTKSTYYSARKINLLAALLLGIATSLFLPAQAEAEQVMTKIICASPDGTTYDYQVGWDNSADFFADKGYIPRLWCEGGYAGPNYTYVSDELSNSTLGWYNGTILVPVVIVDTPTVVETSTINDTTSVGNDESATVQDTVSSVVSVDTSTPVDTVVVEEVVQPTPPSPPVPPAPPVVAPPPPVVEPAPPVEPEPAPDVAEPPPSPEPPAPPVEVPVEEPPPPAEEPPSVEIPIDSSEPPVVVEPTNDIPVQVEPQPIVQPMVTLSNGVVITEEVAVALELFNNPGELLSEVFTNPGAVLTAFSNIGADMSPQVRDKAEKTIVAAVIVGQIATQSAVTAAAGAASYRRKP